MIFGLNLKDAHGPWYILVGILLVRHLRRESTGGRRAYASIAGVNAGPQGCAPESDYYGEIQLALTIIIAIGIARYTSPQTSPTLRFRTSGLDR
jgi:hypothetical protein